MGDTSKTAVVTGALQGIGAGLVQAFLKSGYRVVANSRSIIRSKHLQESATLALVEGDIGDPATAAKIVDAAVTRFGGIDILVNNAGIYFSKPFTDYTLEDLRALLSVTRSLAMEYAKQGIRVNAVAPGIVDTPMHKDGPKEFLRTLQPMGGIAAIKDVVDAVKYLTEAGQVSGEVLHVDGGAHAGRW
jgi:NAD(P)-dependent dehydrogenase (short-subunit alcohol dehydrogenase family)